MTETTNRPSDQTRLRRVNRLGHYDRETIDSVLDSGFLAHLGYTHNDSPIVTPLLYWREGDFVYWHGSTASRLMKHTIAAPVCMTITHLDGIVMAKSAFHHSANFRSVMLFGQGEAVADPEAKTVSLKAFMDKHFPGRWDILRAVKGQELKATMIGRMRIDECSAKIRTGPANEDADDVDLPIWSGVLKLQQTFSIDETGVAGTVREPPPDHVLRYAERTL